MIPVKLELLNFLAYREPEPLDLTGLHLACLAGANGAGKSSILDAITWSLWGKARTNSDKDLIHSDQLEMQVRLTFRLDQNMYRVTRHLWRSKNKNSTLAFEIQDSDTWRSIGETTQRGTQRKIIHTLRLTYETFVNSAFLMQGRADEFTSKPPGKRKEILSEILGLDEWGAYEEQTRKHLRRLKDSRQQIDTQLDTINQELAREEEYKQELATCQEELDAISLDLVTLEETHRVLDEKRRQRDQRFNRAETLDGRMRDYESNLIQLQVDQNRQVDQLETNRELLVKREDIEAGYATLQEALSLSHELGERLLQQGKLNDERRDFERIITEETSVLRAERDILYQQAEKLGQKIASSGDEALLREAREQVEELESDERELVQQKDRMANLNAQITSAISENEDILKPEMKRLRAQRDGIEDAVDSTCPLCEQSLNENHRGHLLETLQTEGESRVDRFNENKATVGQAQAEIKELEKSAELLHKRLRKLPELRQQTARLEADYDHLEAVHIDHQNLIERLTEINHSLDTEDYALDARQGLGQLDEKLQVLGYNTSEHEAVRERLTTYASYEEHYRQLNNALERIPELETLLADLEGRIADINTRINDDQVELENLTNEIELLNAELEDFAALENNLEDLREQEGRARYRVGAANQKVSSLEQQHERRTQKLDEREEVVVEESIYNELQRAFGKDGIPAMIIEAAIPELEKDANNILARMTNGGMHLQFDTQKELVSGKVKETLDIRISDELGSRDYMTFSGGEAFRVNFAIRLALSRLLARRSGAQLRTLVIDEGFGTQDSMGRDRLVQAITSIQDDFDLILVITHIDELKEKFPAWIEVTKTSNGSVIELV